MMAACIHTSRTDAPRNNPLSYDSKRSQLDEDVYNYVKYFRPSLPFLVSCPLLCENQSENIHGDALVELINLDENEDDLWLKMRDEARSDIEQAPILSNYYYSSILAHDSMGSALANHLSMKLGNFSLPSGT
jgi:serine O-acetyltransferase